MELEKTVDSSEVIEKLLEDNKRLRLELAVLSAYEKQINKKQKEETSKKSIIESLSEEDLNKISPEALKALQTLKVE